MCLYDMLEYSGPGDAVPPADGPAAGGNVWLCIRKRLHAAAYLTILNLVKEKPPQNLDKALTRKGRLFYLFNCYISPKLQRS